MHFKISFPRFLFLTNIFTRKSNTELSKENCCGLELNFTTKINLLRKIGTSI